ncbi:hypothetical protein PHJA_000178700 [Phtheirospermum japonicum]|uniref:INO80 complex subunit B-like conserved region domain-containing protein n=1 Tax=Phtheirospermum japonicum TaxID=374723 RepID=A0A830B763_9LAMI|nr:hypothetical protein PHJA_000178700 [Phtheirospermum japonicum]
MDNYGDFGPNTKLKPLKKKRSNLNRRPQNESESPQEYCDSISRASYSNLADAEKAQQSYDEHGILEEMNNNKMSEIANPGQPKTASGGIGTGNKISKVKLKVGGVTHTIHTRSSSDGSSVGGTSTTKSTTPDATNPLQKLSCQADQKAGLRGVPWKTGFSFQKVDMAEESVKQSMEHRRPSKSKRKKYLCDDVYDEEDDDDEIRYLQKLKFSRIASFDESTEYEDETRGKKLRKISKVMDRDIHEYGDYDSSRSVKVKERKKSRSVRASEDTDYMDDEESVSDGEIKHKNMKMIKEPINLFEYSKESSITTRRKAILTSRNVSDGLPPAPPRKTKEQLSEADQQLKRAEAAQRRKIQNEKAARESEAEAIRKILGQDSSRKRREEKIKKRQEELAQERSANAGTVASDVIRWVMGPSGTVVTFPDEIGLPSIFEPKPCSYPPPREKCVGPSCTNVYKYRDSKSKLPLCSLRCYKAIHDNAQLMSAC